MQKVQISRITIEYIQPTNLEIVDFNMPKVLISVGPNMPTPFYPWEPFSFTRFTMRHPVLFTSLKILNHKLHKQNHFIMILFFAESLLFTCLHTLHNYFGIFEQRRFPLNRAWKSLKMGFLVSFVFSKFILSNNYIF